MHKVKIQIELSVSDHISKDDLESLLNDELEGFMQDNFDALPYSEDDSENVIIDDIKITNKCR